MEYKVLEFSTVLVGNINPRKITPYLLAKHSLIPDDEAKESDIDVLAGNLSKFSLSDWGLIEATKNRCMIKTLNDASHEVIKDIGTGLLLVNQEFDIKYIGINHIFHYELNDRKFKEIGNLLAPFDRWDGILNEPRMLNLEMIQNKRNDGNKGYIRTKIYPSEAVKQGASISINDHFQIPKETSGHEIAINLFNDVWDDSKKRSINIANSIINKI